MEKVVRILKKIKIKNLVILIFLIIFNVYAWFIFATKVSTDITVNVSSWNVEFSTGDTESTTNIIIDVERVFPGMVNYEKLITVKNKGEVKAELGYNIKSLRVMDDVYTVGENTTTEELEETINNKYPFKIKIVKDDSLLTQGTGNGTFTITVEWPFESGDDEQDTLWGNKAYDYYENNKGSNSCIQLQLELEAKQIAE